MERYERRVLSQTKDISQANFKQCTKGKHAAHRFSRSASITVRHLEQSGFALLPSGTSWDTSSKVSLQDEYNTREDKFRPYR